MIEYDLARIADALERISAILYTYVACHVPTRVATSWSKPEPDKEPEVSHAAAPEQAPKKTRSPRTKVKADPIPEPAPEPEPEPAPEQAPVVPPSADELRARMRAIAAAAPGNRDKVIAAMQTFGVSNFSKLDPEDYLPLSQLLDVLEEDSKP